MSAIRCKKTQLYLNIFVAVVISINLPNSDNNHHHNNSDIIIVITIIGIKSNNNNDNNIIINASYEPSITDCGFLP